MPHPKSTSRLTVAFQALFLRSQCGLCKVGQNMYIYTVCICIYGILAGTLLNVRSYTAHIYNSSQP